jgi:hypothetical protein
METLEKTKRTGKESATLVEKVITHILKKKAEKKKELEGTTRIPKQWFNDLISTTCFDNDISEGHIRLVGSWSASEEVDEETPKD